MLYLRWVKEINDRLLGRDDVINLAGSAFHLPEATRWLERQLSEEGASLLAAERTTSNEFGLPELKERIRTAYQIPAEREILVTGGATGSIRFVYQLLLAGKGPQHFVAEQPIYEPLASMARRMGATVDLAPRGGGARFVEEVAQRLTPHTAAVVLTNPHNPTGDLLDRDQLRELVDVVAAKASSAVIVIDETFGDLSRHVGWSTGNVDPRIVTVSGLTKCYGLGSIRCGWTTVDAQRFPTVTDDWIEFENIGCPWTEQLGARAIGEFDSWRPLVATKLAAARDILSVWLGEMAEAGLLATAPVRESCVVFPRWLGDLPTLPLVERLLVDHGVLVAPGEFFFPTGGPSLRIGYGGSETKLREGLQRLSTGLRAVG